MFQDINFGNDIRIVRIADKVNSFSSVLDVKPQLSLYSAVAIGGICIAGRLLIGKDGYGGKSKKRSR